LTGKSGTILDMTWDRLGEAVRARRLELGLTQAQVSERGGPSTETLRMIENKRAGRLSYRLRRHLEDALEWEPRSVDEVLAGAEARVKGQRVASEMASPEESRPEPHNVALAATLLNTLKLTERQLPTMDEAARAKAVSEIATYAKQAEDSIIKMMPWLDDEGRGEAIRILAELRRPIGAG
jgi:transcriptional regulator with XRE-family HTH domain